MDNLVINMICFYARNLFRVDKNTDYLNSETMDLLVKQ